MINHNFSDSTLRTYMMASALGLLALAGCSDSNNGGEDQPMNSVPMPIVDGPIPGDASLPGPFFPGEVMKRRNTLYPARRTPILTSMS